MLRAEARCRPGEEEPYFMSSIKRIVDAMDPERAMEEIAAAVKGLFGHVSEQARMDFITALIGDADDESVPGLVHL